MTNADTERNVDGATIMIDDRSVPVYTNAEGHFWRPLLPASSAYVVHAAATGYFGTDIAVQVAYV